MNRGETSPPFLPPGLTSPAKARRIESNRVLLEGDLWARREVFESRPSQIELRRSNLCNMSCVMCYDGENPPPRRMEGPWVEDFLEEVLPGASVLIPFGGSEPLLDRWPETVAMARRHEVELEIVTNAQLLDEKRLRELEPFAASLTFSIDSHDRGIYGRIRKGADVDRVFRNLPPAVRFCWDHGMEPQANVVLLEENADTVHETIAWLAGLGVATVRLRRFLYRDPTRASRDPLAWRGASDVALLGDRARATARREGIRLALELNDLEILELRGPAPHFRRSRKSEPWIERLSRFFPGFCFQAAGRLRVDPGGEVYPCCYAEGATLRLGDLSGSPFEEVWNGPEARRLRRGFFQGKPPDACHHCIFHAGFLPPEHPRMPLDSWFLARKAGREDAPFETGGIRVEAPTHLLRTGEAPAFRWSIEGPPVDSLFLVVGAGGEWNETDRILALPAERGEWRPARETWERMRENTGLWWTLWGRRDGRGVGASWVRAGAYRCLVRQSG